MAYLWNKSNDDKWTATELHAAAFLGEGPIDLIQDIGAAARSRGVLLYPNAANTGTAIWALLAPGDSNVYINDTLLENGIRVIADRDAIRIADMPTIYFSAERLACIEEFPDLESVYCPRCKLVILAGEMAVCCSQCGVWHHEQVPEGESCWSYAKTCALCDQSTDLDSAGFRWTPEILWS